MYTYRVADYCLIMGLFCKRDLYIFHPTDTVGCTDLSKAFYSCFCEACRTHVCVLCVCVCVCVTHTHKNVHLPCRRGLRIATINRLLKIIGLFCRRALSKKTIFYSTASTMGWLRLVGSIKLQVSFAEYRLCCRAILQKRPII